MLITENMMVAANFGMQHRDWCVILYKIYHFHQPVVNALYGKSLRANFDFDVTEPHLK